MIQYKGLHHVAINVRNLEKSQQFYEKVLGLKRLDRPPFQVEGLWYEIGPNGQQLHLILYPGQTLRNGGIDSSDGHFAMRVDSFQETVAWLDQCGVEYTAKEKTTAGFPQIFLTDPDHNVIELNTEK